MVGLVPRLAWPAQSLQWSRLPVEAASPSALPVQQLAQNLQTVASRVQTSVSERVSSPAPAMFLVALVRPSQCFPYFFILEISG